MKTQIRIGVFETNSSSVHSCTIASESDYKKWTEGELMVDLDTGEFVSIEEGRRRNAHALQLRKYVQITIEEIREYVETGVLPSHVSMYDIDYITYKQYLEKCGDDEDYVQTSDKLGVVAFGYFGYD